nr:hypothetical protein [Deltaproteobacteria bacterium]
MVSNEDGLARIDDLDPARWAATSAPLSDLHCDPAFLRYIDHETTAAAEQVNREQKVADAKVITVADVQAFRGAYAKLLSNGDGRWSRRRWCPKRTCRASSRT